MREVGVIRRQVDINSLMRFVNLGNICGTKAVRFSLIEELSSPPSKREAASAFGILKTVVSPLTLSIESSYIGQIKKIKNGVLHVLDVCVLGQKFSFICGY